MGKLIFIRHGQSLWNAENRFTGWVDVDLSERGVEEAKESGKLIKDLNLDFQSYHTSFLTRAIRTLEIIMKILNKTDELKKSWKLNERHYGALTGLNKSETKKKLGEEKFKIYRRSWDNPPPELDDNSNFSSLNDPLYSKLQKIPKTESLKDTYERVVPYFESEILSHLLNNKNVIVSAHGNSLRALCKKIFKISDGQISLLEIPTGNPLVIEFNKSGEVLGANYLDQSRKKEIILNN